MMKIRFELHFKNFGKPRLKRCRNRRRGVFRHRIWPSASHAHGKLMSPLRSRMSACGRSWLASETPRKTCNRKR